MELVGCLVLKKILPSLSLFDFDGFSCFGAAAVAEDEQDLSKTEMCPDLFETFTQGFLAARSNLTELERELLPMGAKLMTLKCGV